MTSRVSYEDALADARSRYPGLRNRLDDDLDFLLAAAGRDAVGGQAGRTTVTRWFDQDDHRHAYMPYSRRDPMWYAFRRNPQMIVHSGQGKRAGARVRPRKLTQ